MNVFRTGKQCRERWHNHLDPKINKESWTTSEQELILKLHDVYGNHWSKISAELPGRTDNAVKNFYYSRIRKNFRKLKKSLGLKKKSAQEEKIFKIIESKPIKIDVPKVINQNSKSYFNINSSLIENIEDEDEAPAILCSLSKSSVTENNDITLKMEETSSEQARLELISYKKAVLNYYLQAFYRHYLILQSSRIKAKT